MSPLQIEVSDLLDAAAPMPPPRAVVIDLGELFEPVEMAAFCEEHAVPGCALCRPGLVEEVVGRRELVHVPVKGRCPTCRYPLPCTELHTIDNNWRLPA